MASPVCRNYRSVRRRVKRGGRMRGRAAQDFGAFVDYSLRRVNLLLRGFQFFSACFGRQVCLLQPRDRLGSGLVRLVRRFHTTIVCAPPGEVPSELWGGARPAV